MTAPGRASSPDRDRKAVRHTAAEWLVRRQGGFAAGEQIEFERWLAEDPQHRATAAEMESAWDLVNAPIAAGRTEALRSGLAAYAERQTRRRYRRVFASVGLAAAAALVVAFFPREKDSVSNPALATTVALRPDQRTLPDGSIVEFNAGAEIAVEFTSEKRGVRLVRGEAHFAVVKDANRPFVVSAGAVDVKAVGTAFSVRFNPKQVDVLVTEGRVAVRRVSTAPEMSSPSDLAVEPIYLNVGARVALPADLPFIQAATIEPLSPTEVAKALAWRGKRIEFTDTPVGEAVALFNRQNKLQILIANRADEARCINGIFWSDDPAGFARLLEVSLGMTMVRQGEAIELRGR